MQALASLTRSDFEAVGLLTVYEAIAGLTVLHHLPIELIRRQASSLGLPMHEVPFRADDETSYSRHMSERLSQIRAAEGVCTIAYGDLYLPDVRRAREDRLAEIGFQGLFPLWGLDSELSARRFIDAGWDARIIAVDVAAMDEEFLGRRYDAQLLTDLPITVDRSGERGEFHTFVIDGPLLKAPVELPSHRAFSPSAGIRACHFSRLD